MVMTFTAVATGHNSAPHGRDPNRGIRGRSLILNDSHQDPIFQLQTDDTDVWFCLKTGATLQWVGNLTITGNLKVTGLVDFDSTGLAIDVDIEGDVDIAGGLDVITADAVNLQPSLSSQFTISINTASDRTLTLACDAAAGSNNARNIAITAANAGAGTATITLAAKTEVEVNTVTFDVNATGVATINSVGASNFTTDSGNLTLSTTTSGAVIITSAGLADINAGANLDIDVTGSFDVLASTTFSIDGTGASNVTATSGNLTVSTATSGTLFLTSVALLDIDAGANIDMDVTGTFDLLATSTFSIDGTGASNVTATSGNLTISTATSGTLFLTSVGLLDVDAGANIDMDVTGTFDLLATSTFSIDGTGASNVSATSGNLSISTLTAGTLILDSVALIDMNAGANLDIDVTGATELTTSTTLAFTATGGLTSFTCTGQAFTLDGLSISLDATGGDCNFTNTSNAATDFTMSLVNTGNSANFRNVTITAANAGAGAALLALTGKTMTINSSTLITTTTGAVTFTHSGGAFAVNSTSQDINLTTLVGGDINILAVADLDLDGATVHMNASGQMDIVAGAALNINGVATTLTTTGAFLNTHSGGSWTVNSTSQAINLNTLVGGDININAVADLDLDGATFHANSSGQMDIVAGAALNITGVATTITTTGAVTFTHSGGAFAINSTSQNVNISTLVGGDINLLAVADLDLDGATLHIDTTGQADIVIGTIFNLTATGGKNTWTATGREIEIACADLDIDTSATVNVLAGSTLTLASTTTAALTGGTTLTLTASAGVVNLVPSTTVQVGGNNVFTTTGVLTAAIEEDTDGVLWVPATNGTAQGGTWTAACAGTTPTVTRTASAAVENFWVNVQLPAKLTASKGYKITSVEMIYQVTTADLDDVTCELYKITYNGNGAAPTSSQINGTYDADHDSGVERGDKDAGGGEHTQTYSIVAPAYDGATKTGYMIKVICDGDGAGSGILILKGFLVHYSETIA